MTVVKPKYRGTIEYHLCFCKLVEAARHRGTVTYQEIAKVLGLPLTGSYMGKEVGHLVGEISEDEVTSGRPMLSAIVVGVNGKVGKGFFTLARQLGRLGDQEEESFWNHEKSDVNAAWAERFTKATNQ